MLLNKGNFSLLDRCTQNVAQFTVQTVAVCLFLSLSSSSIGQEISHKTNFQGKDDTSTQITQVDYSEPTLGFPQTIENKFATDNDEPRLAGLISLSKDHESSPLRNRWSFVSQDTLAIEEAFLQRLPPTEGISNAQAETTPTDNSSNISPKELLALPVVEEENNHGPIFPQIAEQPDNSELMTIEESVQTNDEQQAITVVPEPNTEELDPLSEEEQRLLEEVMRESSTVDTGVLTDARLEEQAKAKIRSAFSLANRRAHYAARQELIEVLRLISQAKDFAIGKPIHTQALAVGIRALDEAEDFLPYGTQLEAELNLHVLTDSHRTPIAKQVALGEVLPQWVMNKYYRYAQLKLAYSVAGNPAGSMALHTLGKIHSQLCKLEPERHRSAPQRAIAFQQAALFAHQGNHMAAHELGVLLAEAGHLTVSERLLSQVAQREPSSIVYRNLALVQEKLGYYQHAAANRAQAHQLIAQGIDTSNSVRWLTPNAFANVGYSSNLYMNTNTTAQASRTQIQQSPQVPQHTHPQFNWR